MATLKANCPADYDCILTDEHAASSYGLPVLVSNDGIVYGPGQCGPVNVPPLDEDQPAEVALVEAARRAGYEVYA